MKQCYQATIRRIREEQLEKSILFHKNNVSVCFLHESGLEIATTSPHRRAQYANHTETIASLHAWIETMIFVRKRKNSPELEVVS